MKLHTPETFNLTMDSITEEVVSGLNSIRYLHGICTNAPAAEYSPQPVDANNNILKGFTQLFAYAVRGELEQSSGLNDDVIHAVAFTSTARLNTEIFGYFTPPTALEAVLYMAVARAKLDLYLGLETFDFDVLAAFFEAGETENLSIYEVALLAGMDEKSVRNATQRTKENRLITFRDELVSRIVATPEHALNWLKDRRGFRSTVCESELTVGHSLVPKAKDGSLFTASCRMRQGFKIGKKGAEIYVSDLNDALNRLKKMDKAYWRRPNKNGTPGIVSATEWVPIKQSQFESES